MRTTMFAALLAAALATGCNKPSESECRKAIANMRRLLETDKNNVTGNVEAAIRRCRGSSTKKSVACATAAQSLAELGECGLLPPPAPGDDQKAEPTPSAAPPSPAPEQPKVPAAEPPPAPAPTPGAPPVPSPSAEPPAPGSTAPAPEPATR